MSTGRRIAQPDYRGRGTRFRLYPQPPVLESVHGPETVWVSRPPGSVGPGPSDERMYVVDVIGKERHYEYPYLPPWDGPSHPPVQPGPDGHFDHLTDSWSREFMAAHMYGTLRFVLDVWEKYFGGPLPWHFEPARRRLELVPVIAWDNAHSGFGFIETGFSRDAADPQPFCLNFDVLAHELGHSFIYELLGTPPGGAAGAAYFAFHESASDWVAMIAALHFDSVVDRLLARTHGNIYLPNELNRIGELSETKQIRLASQSVKLTDVPDMRTPPASLTQPQRHVMSLPLTGAVFDVLVEVFQELLVRDGLISRDLDRLSRQEEPHPGKMEAVQARFDRAFAGRHDAFKAALLDARDYMGRCLAAAWRTLSWDMSYGDAAAALLAADARIAGGAGREIMLESLSWRGIEVPFRSGRRSYSERVARARSGG